MSEQKSRFFEPGVPMSSPDLTSAERDAIARVLDTPNLSMGPEIQAFEDDFRSLTGWPHAIGVSSGTAGLHLCVRAAGIQEDDLVLTTPFSFVASTNVILFERAVPVFVDVDPLSGNIDPIQVQEAVTDLMQAGTSGQKWLPRRGAGSASHLKAILPVDVFGQPADMDPIQEIAQTNGLKVIEDACESLGAEYKGRKAGTLGDYGVYAFYPNKQITTGEGGMIVTQDEQAANLMRALRNQGRAPGDTWLQHKHLGYNYRLDEMSAALGHIQMQRLETLMTKRAQVAAWYDDHLQNIPGLLPPPIVETTTLASWFVYVVRLDPSHDRDRIAQGLQADGVPVRPYFVPIHLQPYMVQRFGYQAGDFPITEDLGRRGLALPFSSVMTEKQVDWVVQVLKKNLP